MLASDLLSSRAQRGNPMDLYELCGGGTNAHTVPRTTMKTGWIARALKPRLFQDKAFLKDRISDHHPIRAALFMPQRLRRIHPRRARRRNVTRHQRNYC